MNSPAWSQFRALLRAARRRTTARLEARRRQLGGSGRTIFNLGLFSALMFQLMLTFLYQPVREIAGTFDAERSGRLPVSSYALWHIEEFQRRHSEEQRQREQLARSKAESNVKRQRYLQEFGALDASAPRKWSEAEARDIDQAVEDSKQRELDAEGKLLTALDEEAGGAARRYGSDNVDTLRARLRSAWKEQGAAAFTPATDVVDGPLALRVLTLLLVFWWLGLTLQGENMAGDTTKRRHPMWEWYLQFPLALHVALAAESLMPLAGNPFMLAAPLLIGTLSGIYSGSWLAGLVGLLAAVPLVLAASLWAKALEVLIMLRGSMRNRAAWFSLLSVVGLVAFFAPMVAAGAPHAVRRVIAQLVPVLDALPAASWLIDAGDPLRALRALATGLALGLLLGLPAFALLKIAVARGIESGFGNELTPKAVPTAARGWPRDPLVRKELLWLKRDRGAIVQLFAVPLLLVALQAFNFRNMISGTDLTWNKLAALIVGMGAYMLFITGPRALLSEGPALMLTLSWPRSLEDTLRVKVRLLFALVSVMVVSSLAVVAWMFPTDAWKLALVALAWPAFGLSIAEKAVTLIQAPAQSGESEPVPPSRQWAAGLGNLTFSIGLFSAQWQLAFAAVVMNWVFAGALWQGFRHRLPYLFDPTSEPQLTPPTILSAVIAIVGMLELGAVITVPMVMLWGQESAVFAQTLAYAISASTACVFLWHWQRQRDVELGNILRIDDDARVAPPLACVGGVAIGILLGLAGAAYVAALNALAWPELKQLLDKSAQFLADPEKRRMYAIAAIGVAPWVEEYLFRGVLFRAMQPQWGTPRAIVASAAFFAVLHPMPAWPPVFALGALNAWLLLRTRALLPCVLLHMAYNTVVLLAN
jgi:membrane protease YdiL (CAAX protease family)